MYKLCVAFAALVSVAVAKPAIGYEVPAAFALPYYSGYSYPYYPKAVAPVSTTNFVTETVATVPNYPPAPITPVGPVVSGPPVTSYSGPAVGPIYAKSLPTYPYGYPSPYSYPNYPYPPAAYTYPGYPYQPSPYSYGYSNSFLLKKK